MGSGSWRCYRVGALVFNPDQVTPASVGVFMHLWSILFYYFSIIIICLVTLSKVFCPRGFLFALHQSTLDFFPRHVFFLSSPQILTHICFVFLWKKNYKHCNKRKCILEKNIKTWSKNKRVCIILSKKREKVNYTCLIRMN